MKLSNITAVAFLAAGVVARVDADVRRSVDATGIDHAYRRLRLGPNYDASKGYIKKYGFKKFDYALQDFRPGEFAGFVLCRCEKERACTGALSVQSPEDYRDPRSPQRWYGVLFNISGGPDERDSGIIKNLDVTNSVIWSWTGWGSSLNSEEVDDQSALDL